MYFWVVYFLLYFGKLVSSFVPCWFWGLLELGSLLDA